ncbi:response regulator [Dyadobacter frigoris]|uniref:Response regulator transcription factor n=1 Tax=Dyadobacter frigoris TaxID=2576211 RepID=A0A4U6D492_9BACT|nr:response regulator transcription factor [Dyadobacter frigoris]TKT91017.1 response regulator transcription factor [Dyadobacter frigoris]GLU56210.1 DNA-binding response regulator [Dyadobacter frigoris]
MPANPRILIIEDHEIVIWALTKVITGTFANATIFSAPTLDQGIEILQDNFMNLVVVDVDIPGGNSIKMIAALRSAQPKVQILIHTGMEEDIYALEYLSAGANGFVSKKAPFLTVSEAIKLVISGKNYISPLTKNIISDNFLRGRSREANSSNHFNLTIREKEITRLLLKGKWTKEIANELGLQLTTISTHKGRIFEKFGVTNSIELYIKIQKELPLFLKELT